jgi:predicted dienelactone hydrolase
MKCFKRKKYLYDFRRKNFMKILIAIISVAIQLIAEANNVDAGSHGKPMPVGVITRDFVDSSRTSWPGTGFRPVRSVIWYPAEQGTGTEIMNDPSQVNDPASVFRGADILLRRRKYPLAIISHGSQGNAQQMAWLGIYLASKGYISVAINHNGTDEEERKTGLLALTDFCMWERPADISVVIDKMLKDPVFSPGIDTSRIVCAGFSLGGATAIWVAGAIFNIDSLAKNEPAPPPMFKESIDRFAELAKTDPIILNSYKHRSDSYKDSRIKAVFALAPAIGNGFTREGLSNISIPVQIVVGDADIIAPKKSNAEHYSKDIPSARPLIILPGERGHYLSPPAGTERSDELLEVSRLAFSFFQEVLK